MLAVFSGQVVEVPAELVAAGSRTPSPKTKASQLVGRFLAASEPAVSVQLGDHGHLAYSHTNQALLRPRYVRTFVYCWQAGRHLLILHGHYPLRLRVLVLVGSVLDLACSSKPTEIFY